MVRAVAIALMVVWLASIGQTQPTEATESKYPRLIRGQVTDELGAPIKQARVEFGYFTAEAGARDIVLTDELGEYKLWVHRAGPDFRLGVHADGYEPRYRDGVIPGTADQPTDFSPKLPRSRDVIIRFVSGNGKPAAGLKICPTTPSSGFSSSFSTPIPQTPFPGGDRTVTTDAEGKVTLRNLPAAPTAIGADAEINWIGIDVTRGASMYSHHITDKQLNGAKDGVVTVSLPDYQLAETKREGVLRYRVVDKTTGKPIGKLRTVHRHSTRSKLFETNDGRIVLGGKLQNDRRYQIRVFADGYGVAVARNVAKHPDEAKEHTIELAKRPSFRGRLVNELREPIEGVRILTGHAKEGGYTYIEWSSFEDYADGNHCLDNVLWCTTDEEGHFVVPEAPAMPVSLLIKTPGLARTVVSPENRPKADPATGIHTIQVSRGTNLTLLADRGTQLGSIATGASVQFRSDDGFEHMYHGEDFDERGERVFDSLAPGEYDVILYSDIGSANYPVYSKRITLKAGEDQRIKLGQMPGSLTISGTTSPFATIQVSHRQPRKGPNHFAVHADIDGEFELGGLVPADYSVSVSHHMSARGFVGRARRQSVDLKRDLRIELR